MLLHRFNSPKTQGNLPVVVLVGGAGDVGRILSEGLKDDYRIVVVDCKKEKPTWFQGEYHQADATNYEELLSALPDNVYCIWNLLKKSHSKPETNLSAEEKAEHSKLYINGGNNILHAAEAKNIQRVVHASSNHVTGLYEQDGKSLLTDPNTGKSREITEQDLPKTDSYYAHNKLFMEQAGDLFAQENKKGISVVNIRIGTVVSPNYSGGEVAFLKKNERSNYTLLSHKDLIQLATQAINAKLPEGTRSCTVYGVSNNIHKPWSIQNAIQLLGYRPSCNAQDILLFDAALAHTTVLRA